MKKLLSLFIFVMAIFAFSCSSGNKIDKLLNDYEKLINDTIKVNTRMCDPRFSFNGENAAEIYQIIKRKKAIYEAFDEVELSEYTPEQQKRLEGLQAKIKEYYKTRKYGFLNL